MRVELVREDGKVALLAHGARQVRALEIDSGKLFDPISQESFEVRASWHDPTFEEQQRVSKALERSVT